MDDKPDMVAFIDLDVETRRVKMAIAPAGVNSGDVANLGLPIIAWAPAAAREVAALLFDAAARAEILEDLDPDETAALVRAHAERQRPEAARERERIAQKLEREFAGVSGDIRNLDSDSIIAWVRDGAR